MSHRGKSFPMPILCYVTDGKSLASISAGDRSDDRSETLLKRIAAASAAGVDWIQIREKDLSVKELSSLTRKALAETSRANQRAGFATQNMINDRLDIAFSQRAAGVHLGEQSLPVREVREWLNAQPDHAARGNFLAGVSCHSLESAVSAAQSGADYIFFGPVFTTPSKKAFGAPQGLPAARRYLPLRKHSGARHRRRHWRKCSRLFRCRSRRHRRHPFVSGNRLPAIPGASSSCPLLNLNFRPV